MGSLPEVEIEDKDNGRGQKAEEVEVGPAKLERTAEVKGPEIGADHGSGGRI